MPTPSKRKPPPRTVEAASSAGKVQSLATAARVLEVLAHARNALPLKAIATAADMAAPKAHRYLASWIEAGLVQQRETGEYDLGPFALRLGLAAMARVDAVEVAGAALPNIAARLKMSVLLAVWADDAPVVIRYAEGSAPLNVSARIGARLPLLDSATGRLFAALLPDSVIRSALKKALRVAGTSTRAAWPKQCETIRSVLTATTEGGVVLGINAIAAPIYDHTGNVALAVTCLAPAGMLVGDAWADARAALAGEADAISRQLGGNSVPRPSYGTLHVSKPSANP